MGSLLWGRRYDSAGPAKCTLVLRNLLSLSVDEIAEDSARGVFA
jgi:hypothetical protein